MSFFLSIWDADFLVYKEDISGHSFPWMMGISDSAILLSHSALMTLRHVPLTSAENTLGNHQHHTLLSLQTEILPVTQILPTCPSHLPMEISTLVPVCMSTITTGIPKSIITSLILHLLIYSLIQQRLISQAPFTA